MTTTSIPPDDLSRPLTLAKPLTDASLPHIGLAGDTYTILLTGENTAGRFCLIDMLVHPGGGPPLHRHDFEETFSLSEGELELTFRGEPVTLHAGETVNIPANAPHRFRNVSDKTARMLCICAPAGQDEFFLSVGVKVPHRDSPAPAPSKEQTAALMQKMPALALKFRTEFL